MLLSSNQPHEIKSVAMCHWLCTTCELSSTQSFYTYPWIHHAHIVSKHNYNNYLWKQEYMFLMEIVYAYYTHSGLFPCLYVLSKIDFLSQTIASNVFILSFESSALGILLERDSWMWHAKNYVTRYLCTPTFCGVLYLMMVGSVSPHKESLARYSLGIFVLLERSGWVFIHDKNCATRDLHSSFLRNLVSYNGGFCCTT